MTGILVTRSEGLGRITLNRPEALHALSTTMCLAMTEALVAWENDAGIRAVIIDHAPGTRGFCAGGDIRMLAESGASDRKAAREFFFVEYRLNHLLSEFPKPVIALMDGVTMGGGVGIAMPARFRIATENTTYAMPETGIGLFPDVGGGWYLPRLPGQIGMWLGLTGARLKAADCICAGIATHFLPQSAAFALGARIADAARGGDVESALGGVLDALGATAGEIKELSPEHVERINAAFTGDSVEAIMAALEADGSTWAKYQLSTLAAKSPQALKVTFRQMREGARASSFAEQMRNEYRIATRMCASHDFREGVRALIIDKDNRPCWTPAMLEAVSDTMLEGIFAPLPTDEEWRPL